jgi:protocatechuate 3,4-dioxygenase beta subunit
MKTLFLAAVLLIAVADTAAVKHEPILNAPCDGCEWIFEGMPKSMEWSARIAPVNEPGEPMQINGVVRDKAGKPVEGIIVYAYHTNAKGIYPRSAEHPDVRHGSLRGWARTDAAGRYRFDTIRPAGYPDTDIPVHIHMQVLEPGCCEYTIDEINFDDDPRLTAEKREQELHGMGGIGIVHTVRDARGVWQVTRDIVLGQNIRGYSK